MGVADFFLNKNIIAETLVYLIASALLAFAITPILTFFLSKYKITAGRRGGFDPTLLFESRKEKWHTPTMGGVLIILTILIITLTFNWHRSFTFVPIGVMMLSALLGGVDDLLNIFGKKRRCRNLKHTWRLIKVHKNILMRLWYLILLPWTIFKRLSLKIGSHPGKGVFVHEKLILQFLAGSITAWWIYFKLGEHWRIIDLPFDGAINTGFWIIPLIILIVMFTANAVNIADGMDGLAGGMLIPTFSALFFLSWLQGFEELAFLNATVVGALIAYTYFNIKPARFQMGDIGSLALGALLAVNTIAIKEIAILPFIAFMFYIEAFSVIIQLLGRHFLNRRIFAMAPLHHHFELRGWSEEKTIMRFWIIHLFVVIIGIWISLH